MVQPHGFSWIDRPRLAALARPESADDLSWLRLHGIDLLVSLTEEPLRRDWVNEAGLLVIHEPVVDMEAPTQEQLNRCIGAIIRAHEMSMGVAVHCTAGLGRTGVVVACQLVQTGLNAQNAMARVRRLRPGSIETEEQAQAVEEFARRRLETL